MTKLIEDGANGKMSRAAIGVETMSVWLVDNEVLSIALEGLLHKQLMYQVEASCSVVRTGRIDG